MSGEVRMRFPALALACTMTALLSSGRASAQVIEYGPYRFPSEAPFADSARWYPTPLSPTPFARWFPIPAVDETNHEWRLIGFSPESGMMSFGGSYDGGCPPPVSVGRELLDLGFDDMPAVDGPGADIVIFNWAGPNSYEVAVRPRGGDWTGFQVHHWRDNVLVPNVPTPVPGPLENARAVEIDLRHYEIGPGVEVDLIRLAGDDATNPDRCSDAHPFMAAVLNAPCHCPDDGNECTWDCDAGGECGSRPLDPGTPCSTGVCDGEASPSCVECLGDGYCWGERPRCDPALRTCVECLEDAECNDDNGCTVDACEAGACVHRSVDATCDGGTCEDAGAPAPCVACASDEECDDGRECTADECVENACVHASAPRGTPCEGGACDGAPVAPRCLPCLVDADCALASRPYCVDGTCYACRGPRDCPPNECASDVRCLGGECLYDALPAGSSCSAGTCDGVEPGPACVACLSAGECDDGDPCTADRCEDGACTHTRSCDDGGRMDAGAADAGAGSTPSGCGCRAAPGTSAPLWLAFALLLAARPRRTRRAREHRLSPFEPFGPHGGGMLGRCRARSRSSCSPRHAVPMSDVRRAQGVGG